MKVSNVVVLLLLLGLTTVACQFTVDLPWQVGPETVNIEQEDVAAAATRAAIAASTAVALAQQAGGVAATAVSQGGNLAATAQILPTPGGGGVIPQLPQILTLPEKLAQLTPGADGKYLATVTEQEFNDFISSQGGAAQTDSAEVANIQVRFTGGNIELSGDVTQPLEAPLAATLRPLAVEGQLNLEVVQATVGGFPIPQAMLSSVESAVNSRVGLVLALLPGDFALESIVIGEGFMTVVGVQR